MGRRDLTPKRYENIAAKVLRTFPSEGESLLLEKKNEVFIKVGRLKLILTDA